ncbi:hypothetical protein GCM10022216_18430 [Sphingobacterium kyonggiense]|uniref:Uncharacterized protein n=1 Tax=Sphingobacterium kyonggiense TaxID=714075 RepID=A0ABP7YQP4_9SPHI
MKEKYIRPEIVLVKIYLEDSLAAGSKISVSGGKNTDYTPEVEDWTTPDTETNGFEF